MPPSPPPRRGSPRLRKVLKGLHHQTWELELVVSGLATFALLQVPAPLNELQRVLWVRMGEGAGIVTVLVAAYLKLALYTLLLAFGIHLLVRAFWVGLVGLDSVFPRGIREHRVQGGPISSGLVRNWVPTPRQLMVRADAVASAIFAAAFALVIVLLAAIPTFGGLLIVAYGLAALLPGHVDEMRVFWTVWGIFMVFGVVVPLVDRTLGRRMDPEGLPYRGLAALMKTLYRVTAFKVYAPVFYTLTTHLGTRAVQTTMVGLMTVMGLVFIGNDILFLHGSVDLPNSRYLPNQPSAAYADPNFYEDTRSTVNSRLEYPTIPSPVVTEPYLRLFIPWRARWFDPLVADACPDLEPVGPRLVRLNRTLRRDSTRARMEDRSAESLACAAALFSLELDGAPLEVEPVYSRHPETGLPGLLYMIPTGEMSEARHLLTVYGHRGDGDADRVYPIVFWRGVDGDR